MIWILKAIASTFIEWVSYKVILPHQDAVRDDLTGLFLSLPLLVGQFSDTTVSIPRLSKTFRLHSLVLSRSPYLYRCLVDRPSVIELTAPRGPTIAAYDLIFSHLYRPLSHSDIHYLAAGNPPLYLQLLSVAEDLELDGLKMTLVHVLASSHLDETWAPHLVPYLSSSSDWIKAVDTRLLDYLTRELPRRRQQLDNCFFSVGQRTMTWIGKHRPDDGEGWVCRPSELSHIYAALPVPYLKRCLERLPVQDALQRYQFAKQVLQQTHNGKITLGLRFTKQHGMVVIVMQTPRRKRGTWDPTLYDTYE